jgi:hypothetical protein
MHKFLIIKNSTIELIEDYNDILKEFKFDYSNPEMIKKLDDRVKFYVEKLKFDIIERMNRDL